MTRWPSETEGAGNAGCLSQHPQPHVQMKKAHELNSPQVPPKHRHSLRDGFNGFLRALPGDRAFLPPSSARRVCGSGAPMLALSWRRCFRASLRPSHPAPDFAVREAGAFVARTFVTIAKRPSDGTGRLGSIAVSTKPASKKFSPEGLDAKEAISPVRANHRLWSRPTTSLSEVS